MIIGYTDGRVGGAPVVFAVVVVVMMVVEENELESRW